MTFIFGVHFSGSASAASVNIRQQGKLSSAVTQGFTKAAVTKGDPSDMCTSNSQCSADAPYCIISTSSAGNGSVSYGDNSHCVQCRTAADCPTTSSEPFARCNGNSCSKTSVCVSDSECASVFPNRPYCSSGSCVACTTNSQCSSDTPFCISNVCKSECSTSAQCSSVVPTKPYCTSTVNNGSLTKGQCVKCLSNANCPTSAPFCKSSVCTSTCQYDTQCKAVYGSAAAYCLSGTCKECSTDSQCASKNANMPYCNNNVCQSSCTSNSQCKAYYYCYGSGGCGASCKPNCSSDNDCSGKQRCATSGCGTYCKNVDCKVTSDCTSQTGYNVSCSNYTCSYTAIPASTPTASNSSSGGCSSSTGGC